MSSDYTITYRGTDYVLSAGLLVEAHQQDLRSIGLQMVQLPTPSNGSWAICRARVTTERGTFTSYGDARPGNAGCSDTTTLIRLSQIRAKAHALCDALNLALIPIEGLPGYVPDWLSVPEPTDR